MDERFNVENWMYNRKFIGAALSAIEPLDFTQTRPNFRNIFKCFSVNQKTKKIYRFFVYRYHGEYASDAFFFTLKADVRISEKKQRRN